jgi:putative heme transporter
MKKWIGPAMAIAVVAVFVFVLPRIADYSTVWDILTGVSAAWALGLVIAVLVNLASFGLPWMAAIPHLGFRRATVVTQSSTAASIVLPGGDVVGMGTQFAMLRGWGFETDQASLAVVITGIWNQLVRVAFPVIAVGLLAIVGDVPTELRIGGAVGAVVFALVLGCFIGLLASDRLARRIGELGAAAAMWFMRLIRRPRPFAWGDDAVRFRASCEDLVRRRWPHLTVTTVFGHLSNFAVLLVSLRAVGIDAGELSGIECFAAFSLIRLLTAVPITPGGLGVVELGLTGGLVAFGADQEAAVAGVLLYRALTMLPVIVIGAVCFLLWRRVAAPTPQAS